MSIVSTDKIQCPFVASNFSSWIYFVVPIVSWHLFGMERVAILLRVYIWILLVSPLEKSYSEPHRHQDLFLLLNHYGLVHSHRIWIKFVRLHDMVDRFYWFYTAMDLILSNQFYEWSHLGRIFVRLNALLLLENRAEKI